MGETPRTGPRVAVAAGGTGGHVYPALAVVAALRRQRPEAEFLFIGGDRLEARLAPEAGLPFRAISVHGLAGRGLSDLPRRLRAASELAVGLPLIQSLRALRGFGPDVVMGTGGYVSGPVLLAARLMGVRSLAVAGDRAPGWTIRLTCRLVDVMALAWEDQQGFFSSRARRGAQVSVTGLPVRGELLAGDRARGAAVLGLDPAATTLLVLGGSLGSRRINEAVIGALRLMEREQGGLSGLQVLHVTGERYGAEAASGGARLPSPAYRAVPYLHGTYADALAAADLVISRAGASAVAELTACGLPMVLIPWSGASGGEQVLNAEPLARAGAAVVIQDEELTEERLAAALGELLRGRERREAMAQRSRALGRPEAAERVAALLVELAEAKEVG